MSSPVVKSDVQITGNQLAILREICSEVGWHMNLPYTDDHRVLIDAGLIKHYMHVEGEHDYRYTAAGLDRVARETDDA